MSYSVPTSTTRQCVLREVVKIELYFCSWCLKSYNSTPKNSMYIYSTSFFGKSFILISSTYLLAFFHIVARIRLHAGYTYMLLCRTIFLRINIVCLLNVHVDLFFIIVVIDSQQQLYSMLLLANHIGAHIFMKSILYIHFPFKNGV